MNHQPKKKDTLQLTQQQISQMLALSLVVTFFVFMAGFYWGKKSVIEPYIEQVSSDSLSDKVSYAFCTLYDAEEEDEAESKEDTQGELNVSDNAVDQDAVQSSKLPISPDNQDIPLFVAQIAGFGTKRAAERCLENLKNNGFAVTMKSRKSETSKGKEIIWYQVVTEPVEDREQLSKLVDQIKKVAKVKDVPIIQVKK